MCVIVVLTVFSNLKIDKQVAIVEELKVLVEQALVRLFQKNEHSLRALSLQQISSLVTVEPCKRPEYGDFSCGVAMRLSQGQDLSAIELAQKISVSITKQKNLEICGVNVSSPGFINFSLTSSFLSSVLLEIHRRFSVSEQEHHPVRTESNRKNCYELCCSILKCATEPSFDLINEIQLAPFLSGSDWRKCKLEYKKSKEFFDAAFDTDPNLFRQQKSLVLMLDRTVRARDLSAHSQLQTSAMHYGPAIAESFAKFYQANRIFTNQPELTKARLGLVLAVKLVLEQTLRSQFEQASELC